MPRSTQQIIEEALALHNPDYGIEPEVGNSISVRQSERTGNYELTHKWVLNFAGKETGKQYNFSGRDDKLVIWVNSQNVGLEDGMKLEGFKLVKRA